MKDNGNSESTLADQLAEEIREHIKEIVSSEFKDRVKSAVLASIKDLPKPVVEYTAPEIVLPRQGPPVVNVNVDTNGLADAIARAIKLALSGLTIQSPTVTVNPNVEVTIEKKSMDVSFERNRDGFIISAKVTPSKKD
jgi:hypothetical protein